MIDYVGRSQSPLDGAQQWGQYFGEVHQRNQARWADNELRQRYDEQNRYNLADARDTAQFMNENRGLFDDGSTTLAGLRPQNVAPATATNVAASAGSTGAGIVDPSKAQEHSNPTASQQLPMVDYQADVAAPIEQRQYTREELRQDPALARRIQDAADRGEVVIGNLAGGNVMVYPRTGSPPNTPHIGPLMFPRGNPNDVGGGFGFGVDPRFTAGYLGMRPLTRRRIDIDATETPLISGAATPEASGTGNTQGGLMNTGATSAPVGTATQQAGVIDPAATTVPGAQAPAQAALDPYFQGVNDTSRPLQPTREMRLLETAIESRLRRANTAAQHGQMEVAHQEFAAALQGQAQMLQAERTVLYRAASNGSLDAASRLLEEFHGYPPGTVRMQPTDEQRTRFNIQIDNGGGNWVSATSAPLSRDELLSGFLNLIDAEGAAARLEADQEYRIAAMRAGADLQVARIRSETDLAQMISDTQIAQLDSRTRIAIRQGTAQLETNAETGELFIVYPQIGPDGRVTQGVQVIRGEDVPAASTNGNGGTVRSYSMTAVTGVPNVRAN